MKPTEIDKSIDKAEDKNRWDKFYYRAGFGVIILAALFSFFFFYQVFFPPKVIDIKTQPLKIKTPRIMAGEKVSFEIDYCKYQPRTSNLTVTYVNGEVVSSFITARNLPTGCHKTTIDVAVPVALKADEYHLELIFEYKGGFFGRSEIHELRTETFKVSGAGKGISLLTLTEAVDSIEQQHERQNKAFQCMIFLFGERPGQVITRAEFEACLRS